MVDQKWLHDFENIVYIFNTNLSYDQNNIALIHIERQDDSGRTLCGKYSGHWIGAASPEPDETNREICYASCKKCIKAYDMYLERYTVFSSFVIETSQSRAMKRIRDQYRDDLDMLLRNYILPLM